MNQPAIVGNRDPNAESDEDRFGNSVLSFFQQTSRNPDSLRRFRLRIQEALAVWNEQSNIGSLQDLAFQFQQLKKSEVSAVSASGEESLDWYAELFSEHILPNIINVASPRFVGHMTSALPEFMHELAEVVVQLNQNLVKLETSGLLTSIERDILAQIHQSVYARDAAFYQEHAQNAESILGIHSSGGTLANITAMWCARNNFFRRLNPDANVAREGFFPLLRQHDYAGAVIIGSELMHYSFEKAVDLMGLGTSALIKLPVDESHAVAPETVRRCIEDSLRRKQAIIAVIGIAGTTDSGAIDPLADLAGIAQEHDLHFHVDAAWGGAMSLSNDHKHLLEGIERADTVTIDGHKQMYTPMGIGFLLCRDPRLARAIEKTAHYVVREGAADLGRHSLQGSREASILYVHAALQLIGEAGFAALIERNLRLANSFKTMIDDHPRFECLNHVETNIVLYRYVPANVSTTREFDQETLDRLNSINTRLQRRQREAGRSFVSRTQVPVNRVDGRHPAVGLRAVLSNPHTTTDHLRGILEEQVAIAESLS